MCGIAGIFDTKPNRIPNDKIERLVKDMICVIKHRGPDDEGVYCGEGVGLGSSRLSILDLSAQGHMPMLDEETGNYIVHNGEVYNYKELREGLGLTNFKSKTDTEVILKAYSKYGQDCLRYLNGMYAFCIWDSKNKRLFCARDRIGIKPFFYTFYRGAFYFASEIKSILRIPGIPRIPNMKIIYQYLAYGVYDHSEETFFEGIKQLPAGHSLTVEKGTFFLTRYWDISPALEMQAESLIDKPDKYELTKEKFMEGFEDSIRLRLRSDVPIGVNVSGGLDSTFMMATINKIGMGQGSLKAFSYCYGDERYDEKPFVEELVKKLDWKVENHCRLSVREVPELFQEAMYYQEQPFPGIPTLAKHKLIKESCRFDTKVILEGQGGDEIGGGYQYFFGPYVLDLIEDGKLGRAIKEIYAFGSQNNISFKQAFDKVLNGIKAYYKLGRSADGIPFAKTRCLNPDFFRNYAHKPEFPKPFKSNLLNMQYRDIMHTKLPRILRSCDRASMAYGRELRVPLLDHRLVEFTFTLPGYLKMQNGIQRFFMRDIAKSFFPSALINLPKRAVVDPQREWIKGPLSDWVGDVLHSESFKKRSIFDYSKIEKEYTAYRSKKVNLNSFHLWQWLSLESWYRMFID